MIKNNPIEINNILNIMKENYDGYKFSSNQKENVYNTTLVVYFLKQLSLFNEIPNNLLDPNLGISESGLSVISISPLAQEIMTELNNNEELYIERNIEPILNTKNMAKLLLTNKSYILSFMYYLGMITQKELPDGKNEGTNFKIPNKIIKDQFINIIIEKLNFSKRTINNRIMAVNELINNDNITLLCEMFENYYFSHLNPNEVPYSLENSLKNLFYLTLGLSNKRFKLENNVGIKDNSFTDWDNFIIELEDKIIYFEFKNIKIDDIILKKEEFFHDEFKSEQEILYYQTRKLNEFSFDQISNFKLKFKKNSKYLMSEKKIKLENIDDIWNELILQTKFNQKWILQKFNKNVISFSILRIGLSKLKFLKID
jgi:hypothetical protein